MNKVKFTFKNMLSSFFVGACMVSSIGMFKTGSYGISLFLMFCTGLNAVAIALYYPRESK